MHLCPGRNFQFVFPLLHVNKLQCLLIVALHGRGRSVCLNPPHTQPVSSMLHLVGVAGPPHLLGFQQVSLSKVGRRFMCAHAHLQT